MATDTGGEEFITIVPVGEGRPPVARDPAFVTVLTVSAAAGAAEVVVRRPRGARLGLGLKFEGGSAASEKVRRLLVQSCAEDSPAANATAPWGKLIPGDEILAIDGVSVSDLTRIDCVRRLKDSDESLTLLVRHLESEDISDQKNMDTVDLNSTMKQMSELDRPTTLPPPVPPRKLGKKNSFKEKTLIGKSLLNADGTKLLGDQNTMNGQHNGIGNNFTKLCRKSSFDSHLHRQTKEGIACLKKGSPEEVRRLVRRLSDGKAMPPEAEVYIDLLSTEWERCLALADAESDDTGSSISTVVDRLGSMASSVENSIPSTPIMQPKTIDIQKVLNCIENIDSNILKDMTSTRFLEKHMEIKNENKIVEKTLTTNLFSSKEVTQNSIISEDTFANLKKLTENDKNNNNTLPRSIELIDKVKPEVATEKPKPMPRNTKIERSVSEKKPRPIPIPETTPPPVPEPLLTPTKKNCIETWLQRSEAEMNNKNIDKEETRRRGEVEESATPEALPRLIDFVPKPQYKEGSEAPALSRPTTAPPPPPPAETREDGSGASLDTIGELDESTDVTDNVVKPVTIENEANERKTFERSFWEDRVIKSDVEDKSLSNDETPLPSCPRQPPDGVETPSDSVEKAPEPPSRLPPKLPTAWPTARSRFSYTSRSQDARSEASVKDKIAMFSTDRTPSSDRIDKCGTLPGTVTGRNTLKPKKAVNNTFNYSEISSLDRRLTKSQDNLDEMPRPYKRYSERPEVLGALENTTIVPHAAVVKPARTIESKPLFYGSTNALQSSIDSSYNPPIYHARSVSDDHDKNKKPHKSNLEYLIEQRKKSMSKLRGLVIPEGQSPIVDLPEIKVQDSLSKTFLLKPHQNNKNNKDYKTNNVKPLNLSESKWKANLLPNNLPKYSPAFKRKSLQVYNQSTVSQESTPERKFNELNETSNKPLASKPLRNLLEAKVMADRTSTLPARFSMINMTRHSNKEYKDILSDIREYKNVEIKICTATEVVDSDNDSAMSSTQSSYRSSASSPLHNLDSIESDSSRLSPRISHYPTYSLVKTEIPAKSSILEKNGEEYVKRNICRSVSSETNVSLSSSAGSAATSGSQASCSSLDSSVADSDKRKVSKTYNIDTINRRNILASAKCRSGRDTKLKSPVVESKFAHDDRSPSPTLKAERLSSLTGPVSAIANKGENRRRNKVIAETDSDSDSEANLRQRKADFKNTRLKRNSSLANKSNNTEAIKVDDAPKSISDKIIKEIKKAGLDNYNNNNIKVVAPLIKNNVEIIPSPIKNNVKTEVLTNHKNVDVVDSLITTQKENSKQKPIIEPRSVKSNGTCRDEPKSQTQVIKLRRGAGSGVGVILAGGIDCEAKDVTVHRVLSDSVAAKAGLKRGAKVRSINGCIMAGLTHAQSVAILKEQRSEVVIEIEDETTEKAIRAGCGSQIAESKIRRQNDEKLSNGDKKTSSVVTVILEKAGGGAGLGFGLDGGRDSPQGDRPLTIKKLFAGGSAAQSGRILVGAELLSAGGQSMEGFTRTQAWAALKALPAGQVALVLRNP